MPHEYQDEIRELINDLARPIFNYRMATAALDAGHSPALVKGGHTKLDRAEKEIHEAVLAYNKKVQRKKSTSL